MVRRVDSPRIAKKLQAEPLQAKAEEATPVRAPTDPSTAAGVTGAKLGAPSNATAQRRGGAKAQLDLREWQPEALSAALALDVDRTFELLKTLPPAITFFGGARIGKDDPYYESAKDIGRWLAILGIPVRTGAGPGIMAAAAEGYQEAVHDLPKISDETRATIESLRSQFKTASGMGEGASTDDKRTQGFSIALPYEQAIPEAIEVSQEIALFPVRKVALYENARGLITFPGGYGTLDELFEVWKLGARGAHKDPMLAYGESFWQPIFDVIEQVAVKDRKLIDPVQMAAMKTTDDTLEVVKHMGSTDDVRAFETDPAATAKTLRAELQMAIQKLDELPPAVTFIGGERLVAEDPTLSVASAVAGAVTEAGLPARVGGDSTLASSVAKGVLAQDPDATVQAFLLEHQAHHGVKGLKDELVVEHFVTHKELIGRRAKAYVALPGGLGTLDELFTILTQLQCKKLPPTPVVLVGKDYWEPIMKTVKAQMLNGERKTISPEDLDLFVITDDAGLASEVAKGALSLEDAKNDPRAAGVRADAG